LPRSAISPHAWSPSTISMLQTLRATSSLHEIQGRTASRRQKTQSPPS